MTFKAAEKSTVCREVAELADRVFVLSESLPPEDRDWLTSPIRQASRSAAERLALGWRKRRQAGVLGEQLAAAEADVHEVQTWALLALRHHHWAADVADEVDRRCEAILDALHEMTHEASRWCGPAGVQRRAA